VAKQLYTVWTAYQAEKVDTQFTQGDLRLGNMVVSADNQLAGVFDFGRAGIGDPSYELSPLANIDLTILAGAIDELQTGGLDINREHIQLWENMRDTLKLTYAVTGEATPSFIAKALLKIPACFPELDWSELDQLSSSSSRSPRITKPSNK
jgi:thiamine kinase-like enzyme